MNPTPATTAPADLTAYAQAFAVRAHADTNHLYDGQPYSAHLQLVYDFGRRYQALVPAADVPYALAACWTHDTIEDCRLTYNDVKAVCGEVVAEITYALTNEKGRTRQERANAAYYAGIRATPLAAFVKVCDRLANAQYSRDHGSRMLDGYRREYAHFRAELWSAELAPMFEELAAVLA